MSRAHAIEIILSLGDETPHDDISRFCDFAGIDKARFMTIAATFRNGAIWKQDADGTWRIPDFLIPEWSWA